MAGPGPISSDGGSSSPGLFFPESYGAKGDGTTDDTTAIQDAIAAAEASNGIVQFSAKTYKITSALSIASSVSLNGVFSAPLVEGYAVATTNVNCSYVSPYLQGTVLLPSTAGQNGINVTTIGEAVNISNIGIRFADSIKFANTGHGIFCMPPVFTSVRDNGIFGSVWNNVCVFGNDSAHYGIYICNGLYNVFNNIFIEGGGAFLFENNSLTHTGNMTINGGWFWLVGGGVSHGVYLKNTSSGDSGVSHISLINCQCLPISDAANGILTNATGTIPGTFGSATNVITTTSTAGLLLGQTVSGTNIPSGSFISAITGPTTFTISKVSAASLPFTAASAVASNTTGTGSAETLTLGNTIPKLCQYLFYVDPASQCLVLLGCSFENASGVSGGVFIDVAATGVDFGVSSINGALNWCSKDLNNFSPRMISGAISWGVNAQALADLRMFRLFDYPANPGVDNTAYSAGFGFDGHSVVYHVQKGDNSASHIFSALDPNWQTSADTATDLQPWMILKGGNLTLPIAGTGIVYSPVATASLPTSPVANRTAMVNDALAPVKGSNLASGGSVTQLVYWNGSNWVIL